MAGNRAAHRAGTATGPSVKSERAWALPIAPSRKATGGQSEPLRFTRCIIANRSAGGCEARPARRIVTREGRTLGSRVRGAARRLEPDPGHAGDAPTIRLPIGAASYMMATDTSVFVCRPASVMRFHNRFLPKLAQAPGAHFIPNRARQRQWCAPFESWCNTESFDAGLQVASPVKVGEHRVT